MYKLRKKLFTVILMGMILCLFLIFSSSLMGAEKKYVFGITQPTFNHPIRQAHYWAAKIWQKDHPNVDFIFMDGQKKAAKQISDVEDLIARRVDVILIAEHIAGSTNRTLKKALEEGIPVVSFDRIITDPSIPVSTITTDDREMGRMCGEYIAERLNGKGNLVIIQAPEGVMIGKVRRDGVHDAIDKYPEIKVIAQQVGNWQRSVALTVMENILQGFKNIDAVYCDNDEMALGAIKAIKEAGRQKEMFVVGIDGQKSALEAIMAGDYAFSAKKSLEFPLALDITLKVLKGEKVPEWTEMPILGVSIDNVKEVYDPFALF